MKKHAIVTICFLLATGNCAEATAASSACPPCKKVQVGLKQVQYDLVESNVSQGCPGGCKYVKSGSSEEMYVCSVNYQTMTTGLPSDFFLTTSCAVDQCASGCVSGWCKFQDSCYKFNPGLLNWADARAACSASIAGANLVSIQTEEENTYVSSLPDNVSELAADVNGYWIGGFDANVDRVWEWSDGSAFVFSKWSVGEPNYSPRARSAYIEIIRESDKWNDQSGLSLSPYICEYKP